MKDFQNLLVEIQGIGGEIMEILPHRSLKNLDSIVKKLNGIIHSDLFIEIVKEENNFDVHVLDSFPVIGNDESYRTLTSAYLLVHETFNDFFWKALKTYYTLLWLGIIILLFLLIFLFAVPFSGYMLFSKNHLKSIYFAQSLNLMEKKLNILALDLHDEVIQKMGLINRYLEENVSLKQSEGMLYLNYSKEIIEKIRILSTNLKTPDSLFIDDFDSAVEKLFSDFSIYSSQKLHIRKIGLKALKWDREKTIHFYRVIQETLNNIHKHSRAENVYISIVYSHPQVTVSIRDDGVGFDLENLPHTGSGLESIRFRLELLHAIFSFDSSPDKGTNLKLKIRIENENAINY